MLKKVAFTMYPVKDMLRARAFYEETLGLGLGLSRNGAQRPWAPSNWGQYIFFGATASGAPGCQAKNIYCPQF